MLEEKHTFAQVTPKYSLRHYQREAVIEAWRELKKSGRVLLHAPTGSGKTRMAMSMVSMHLRERGPTMVLWLAPTSELVVQAAQTFEDAWQHHGDSVAVVIQWRGEAERLSHGMALKRNTVLVAGLQMAVQSAEANPNSAQLLRDKATLVVFDEAHQSVAPTYRGLVEDIMNATPSRCLLLGLSATPGRAASFETGELAKIYGGRKVGIAPGRNPVKALVSGGYMAKANIQVRGYPDSPPPKDTGGEDYPEASLADLGALTARNAAIVGLVQELFNAGHRRVMAFAPSVSSAESCAAAMRKMGERYSHAVVGGMPQDDRHHTLETFRSSIEAIPHPQVVFNCRVLTAGVDLPLTSAVVIGKPTKSDILLQQMIGRALRGPASGGNETADIWILADDSYAVFGDLAEMYSHWDALWEPLKT